MKIIHIYYSDCDINSANGVINVIYYLSQEQVKQGHDISIFSFSNKKKIPIVPNVSVKHFRTFKNPFKLDKHMKEAILDAKPDIVHFHSVYLPSFISLGSFLRKKNISYVVTPHGGIARRIIRKNWFLKIPFKYLLDRPNLNGASFIQVLSTFEEKEAIHYGIKAPLCKIQNGIILPKNISFSKVNKKPIFLFIGRLNIFQKGLDLLLKGFAKSSIEAKLIIVGPTHKNSLNLLKQMANSLNISSKVFFKGSAFGNKKDSYLRSAGFFVHPSHYEGMPISVLEACSYALPSFVSEPASLEQKIPKFNAGILVSTNISEISEAFKKLNSLSNKEYAKMSSNAYNLVKKDFTWKSVAKKLDKEYEKVILNVKIR